MNMRFTKENWRLFFTSGKKTTIRTKRKKTGHYTAVTGSYMKPEVLGEFDLVSCEEKLALLLNDEDAKNDGFETASELFDELSRLNGTSALMDSVYICHVENAERTLDTSCYMCHHPEKERCNCWCHRLKRWRFRRVR